MKGLKGGVLLAACSAAMAGPLDEAHLNAIPRSEAETARIAAGTSPPSDFSKAQPFEALSAGAATVRVRQSEDAFSDSSANLGFEEEFDFKVGNRLFRKLWTSSPSSASTSDGLGALFNARSCRCGHIKDGRGHPRGSARQHDLDAPAGIDLRKRRRENGRGGWLSCNRPGVSRPTISAASRGLGKASSSPPAKGFGCKASDRMSSRPVAAGIVGITT